MKKRSLFIIFLGLGVFCLSAFLFLPASAHAATLYIDGTLTQDCTNGNYSIANRDCSGSDGIAYQRIREAAANALAGDTVLLRGGNYTNSHDFFHLRHSGLPGQPIIFKQFQNENAVVGNPPAPDIPDNFPLQSEDAVITLDNVNYIEFDGITIKGVKAWLFAKNASYITIRNSNFEDGLRDGKGGAKFVYSNHNTIINSSFKNGYDNVEFNASDYNVVENNNFNIARHSLLAIRCGNFNIIRNNVLRNPYYFVKPSGEVITEKLVEVYDCKLDPRPTDNLAAINPPRYDSTKYNLFEGNFFGYHPFKPGNVAAQPSAMQYSGQNGIIRNNVFSNPPLTAPDPNYPQGIAGGMAINMRWGGSWDGWHCKPIDSGQQWCYWKGEGWEAGFVTHNRVYNNTFYGYDQGQVVLPATIPSDLPNPPYMQNTNPSPVFDHQYEFSDNIFKNNIFDEGRYVKHVGWYWQELLNGKPVQVVLREKNLLDTTLFGNNNFYATGQNTDKLIYLLDTGYPPPADTVYFNTHYPTTFSGNIQQDPKFVDAAANDFHLQSYSPLIDKGTFLTKTVGSGSGNTITVEDAGYFFDGFGVAGEQGDLIQLEGQTETARITHIDYASKKITLSQSLSWTDGRGVGLSYSGLDPDLGAYESSYTSTTTTPLPSSSPFLSPSPSPTSPASISPSPVPSSGCQDTDQGQDFYKKGTLTYTSRTTTISKTDYCSGSYIVEWYCTATSYDSAVFRCPQSCRDGACIGSQPSVTPSPALTPTNIPASTVTPRPSATPSLQNNLLIEQLEQRIQEIQLMIIQLLKKLIELFSQQMGR